MQKAVIYGKARPLSKTLPIQELLNRISSHLWYVLLFELLVQNSRELEQYLDTKICGRNEGISEFTAEVQGGY
jgi:hypothetical protein